VCVCVCCGGAVWCYGAKLPVCARFFFAWLCNVVFPFTTFFLSVCIYGALFWRQLDRFCARFLKTLWWAVSCALYCVCLRGSGSISPFSPLSLFLFSLSLSLLYLCECGFFFGALSRRQLYRSARFQRGRVVCVCGSVCYVFSVTLFFSAVSSFLRPSLCARRLFWRAIMAPFSVVFARC
jgi:hypothetical protein